MKSAKFIILFFGLSIILNSCGTLEEAGKVLRNDKRSTDEFLIKKKGPLTQPPDFDKIPEPGSNKNQAESEVSNIERILKKNTSKSNSSKIKSSTTEESILNQIKK